MAVPVLIDYTDIAGNSWQVMRLQPIARPGLVRFLLRNTHRKRLDQTAEWSPNGWSTRRWVPRTPAVPDYLRRAVEGRLADRFRSLPTP